MERYWFRQKRFGYGANPATWQGWVLTVAFMLLGVADMAWGFQSGARHITAAVIILAALSALFIVVTYRLTEGGWRWRWGEKD